ncbi:MAG: peptidoglycan glycosyltransferase [Lachnospiraceae bacterium]|nr:peptidoglycan glycosyltransferase [Lachnospiraceae bacterium]
MAFSALLIWRLFVLQLVRGADYQSNYDLKVEKTETIPATRGNIYDRNGVLLAYDELAYAVTIEDTGTYTSGREKNLKLNEMLYEVITNVEKRGDAVITDFGIRLLPTGIYEFVDSGTKLQRFRADIFGHKSISELSYNTRLGINEAEATADEIMAYLCSDDRYRISDEFEKAMQFKIAVTRYRMSQNSYQKYVGTTIASDVCDETVAYIAENRSRFIGVDIEERSTRHYADSDAFANVIGYTGTISTDEYEALSAADKENYSLTDKIGKAGIEQYMNKYLMGIKGSETVYVDSVGNLIETTEATDPVSGGDVYLSIDRDLQVNAYRLLEKEIAGILYSKIVNTRSFKAQDGTESSDIVIPIYDVYFALINNGVININTLNDPDSSDVEKEIFAAFTTHKKEVLKTLRQQLSDPTPKVYNELDEVYQDYSTYIVKMLKSRSVLLNDAIDKEDEMYAKWTSEELAVNDYLRYAIDKGWMDIKTFAEQSRYVDTDELYASIVDYILETLETDAAFNRLLYESMIDRDMITGAQLCAVLFDQGVLEKDDETRSGLLNGTMSCFDFLKDCVHTLKITPGQLALEPYSGSSVVMNVHTGEVLACVTYPGYDSNRLSNASDSSYYAALNLNLANPLYNNATQQRTAPGSTFKMCVGTAGLSERKIDISTEITDKGMYEKISNHPRCWIYPGSHGTLNLAEAIRHSCNYYFYEVGMRLSGGENGYNDARGIEKIQKYAAMFGLDEKTGVEIEENASHIATEYPVMAAIGQSDNNITTIALARYVTAVTMNGMVYNLSLLDHVTDANGNTLETYGPTLRNQVQVLSTAEWASIHHGMREVVEDLHEYDAFPINVAGKTGTAQINRHPNHALFVGYAPYENPKIAIATRIAYGYTSHNAAAVAKDIIGCYFDNEESLRLADSDRALAVSGSSSVTD